MLTRRAGSEGSRGASLSAPFSGRRTCDFEGTCSHARFVDPIGILPQCKALRGACALRPCLPLPVPLGLIDHLVPERKSHQIYTVSRFMSHHPSESDLKLTNVVLGPRPGRQGQAPRLGWGARPHLAPRCHPRTIPGDTTRHSRCRRAALLDQLHTPASWWTAPFKYPRLGGPRPRRSGSGSAIGLGGAPAPGTTVSSPHNTW